MTKTLPLTLAWLLETLFSRTVLCEEILSDGRNLTFERRPALHLNRNVIFNAEWWTCASISTKYILLT